jgi:uncharacterized protein (DUF58 family)
MVDVRLLDKTDATAQALHPLDSLSLARRLPGLIVSAKEVAATVMHGVHGRRRAGAGETFWQFRPFVYGESTNRIDWRRSARDDRIYVREREWEAAHTVWIWCDRSASMGYVSNLALQPKIDRGLVLALALSDLLVRGGERVGVPGLTRAFATRDIVERLSERMIEEAARPGHVAAELPPEEPPGASGALPSARRQGEITLPNALVSFDEPIANWSMLSLPSMPAPTSHSLAETVDS